MPQNEMTEHEKYSRETDALIAVRLGAEVDARRWKYRNAWWVDFMTQNVWYSLPRYSTDVSAAIRLVQQVASAQGWAISYNPDTDYFAVIEGGIGVGRATGRSGHPARALMRALNEAQRMGFVRSRLNGGH